MGRSGEQYNVTKLGKNYSDILEERGLVREFLQGEMIMVTRPKRVDNLSFLKSKIKPR